MRCGCTLLRARGTDVRWHRTRFCATFLVRIAAWPVRWPSMTLDTQIDRYLSDLSLTYGRAAKTIERYDGILRQFADSSPGGHALGPAEALRRERIEPFVHRGARVDAAPSAPATRKLRRAAIRGLCRYLVREHQLQADPTDGLVVPVVKSRSPGFLEPYEFTALLQAVDENAGDHYVDRDRALFNLGFLCGLRVSELVGLDVAQVDLRAGRLAQVHRKGGKRRDIMLSGPAIEAVRKWLVSRTRYRNHDASPALFLAQRGTRLSVRAVQRSFARYVSAVGFTKRLTVHSLRHSFATALTREVGIEIVSKLMDHASIATTQIYAHVNSSQARSAVDRLAEVTFGPAVAPAVIAGPGWPPAAASMQKSVAQNIRSATSLAATPHSRPDA